jgi:hypothetical protein
MFQMGNNTGTDVPAEVDIELTLETAQDRRDTRRSAVRPELLGNSQRGMGQAGPCSTPRAVVAKLEG